VRKVWLRRKERGDETDYSKRKKNHEKQNWGGRKSKALKRMGHHDKRCYMRQATVPQNGRRNGEKGVEKFSVKTKEWRKNSIGRKRGERKRKYSSKRHRRNNNSFYMKKSAKS